MLYDGKMPLFARPFDFGRRNREDIRRAMEVEAAFKDGKPGPKTDALRLAREADEATETLPVEQKSVWA